MLRIFYTFTKENIDRTNPHELLTMMLILIETLNKDPDIWYNILNKLNDFLCGQQLSKSDIIDFLKTLNHFQPKVFEKVKNINPVIENSHNLFTQAHEEEYLRLRTPQDLISQMFLFLRKNLRY